MKYYYLFGSQICDAFEEIKASKLTRVEKSALKRVASSHGYDLICHDTAIDHPTCLLDQYDGWMAYIELSKGEYDLLSKILKPQLFYRRRD